MAESAALRVDEVFPEQPLRRWIMRVPYPVRFLFASRPSLTSMGKAQPSKPPGCRHVGRRPSGGCLTQPNDPAMTPFGCDVSGAAVVAADRVGGGA